MALAPVASARAQPTPVEVVVPKQSEDAPLGTERQSPREASARGAMALEDFFSEQPSLVATSGNAGLGGAPNKLNLAARGVNPRFSARTQLHWDGMPLAIAPYGRPHLTMLPLSLGWMHEIRVDAHGARPHLGPHAIGGHIGLGLYDLAPGHRELVQLTVNHFGRTNAQALVQMADLRQQWALGYTTLQGPGFRAHSGVNSHAAFLRWRRRLGHKHRLGVLAFGYGEETELPGGLAPADFALDPRASVRPLDRFVGGRIGGGVFWEMILRPGLRLETRAVGGVTDRRSEIGIATQDEADPKLLRVSPRRFAFVQVQGRLQARLPGVGQDQRWIPELQMGVLPTLEWARLRTQDREPQRATSSVLRSDDRSSIAAAALYGRARITDAKGIWSFEAGLRGEWVSLTREDLSQRALGQRRLFALLPSAGLSLQLHPALTLFAAYGRAFSPPQFLQVALAQENAQLAPERGQSAQLGAKASLWRDRVRASVVAFHKGIANYADVSAERLDQPGRLRSFGLESQLRGGWTWAQAGLCARAGLTHTWTHGRIVGGPFDAVVLPWAPPHRWRASAGLGMPKLAHLWLRTGVSHDAAYATDYLPGPQEDVLGARGEIPAWTTWWAGLGVGSLRVGSALRVAVSLNGHNLLNQRQYTRTPDRNAGRLLLSPRRWTLTLRVEHQASRR